jgi:hypothetical protein
MASKPTTFRAERPICFIAILTSIFSVTLRAQTSGMPDAHPSTSLIPSCLSCGLSADESSSDSSTMGQNGSNQNVDSGTDGGHADDWVHSWTRKVDEARASQPHFVSPIVTTHVVLVQQFRYDMSW